MSQPPKPITFRLYPERGSHLFCRVNVWRDHAEMVRYWKRARGIQFASANAGAAAMATGIEHYQFRKGKPPRKTGEFCEINCHRERLDAEIVTHETTHAALRWRARVKLQVEREPDFESPRDVSDAEERFCYALGRMCDAFVRNLRRRGIEV